MFEWSSLAGEGVFEIVKDPAEFGPFAESSTPAWRTAPHGWETSWRRASPHRHGAVEAHANGDDRADALRASELKIGYLRPAVVFAGGVAGSAGAMIPSRFSSS